VSIVTIPASEAVYSMVLYPLPIFVKKGFVFKGIAAEPRRKRLILKRLFANIANEMTYDDGQLRSEGRMYLLGAHLPV
jgi:hypothetical protein